MPVADSEVDEDRNSNVDQEGPLRISWGGITAVVTITLAVLVTFCGLFTCFEGVCLTALPRTLRSAEPRVVMLSLEEKHGCLDAMDVALSLRGLYLLQPSSITICENLESSPNGAPVTPAIANRISQFEHQGVPVIQSGMVSSAMTEREPLFRSFPSGGKFRFKESSRNRGGDPRQGELLPLFLNNTEGSIWWNTIDQKLRVPSPRLLFGRVLVFNNATAFRLNGFGEIFQPFGLTPRSVALEDFLFRMEQKERGTINPGFEEIFHNATVFIASKKDLAMISSMAGVLNCIHYARLSALMQGLLGLCWILLLWIAAGLSSESRILLALTLLAGLIAGSLFLLRQQVLFPLVPGLVACLLILIGSVASRDSK